MVKVETELWERWSSTKAFPMVNRMVVPGGHLYMVAGSQRTTFVPHAHPMTIALPFGVHRLEIAEPAKPGAGVTGEEHLD